MANKELMLLGTWSSPYSLRVVMALRLKGHEYEYIEEDLSNKSSLLLDFNPIHKKIPVLVHNGKPIVESLGIVEYIEETWRQNSLFPNDPYEKAMARFLIKFIDDKFVPSVWRAFLKKHPEEDLGVVEEHLKFLEQELKGKAYFGGETIGVVDIFLGSIVNLMNVSSIITGLNMIDGQKFPILSAWMENFLRAAGIMNVLPPQDKMIIKYRAIHEKFAGQSP